MNCWALGPSERSGEEGTEEKGEKTEDIFLGRALLLAPPRLCPSRVLPVPTSVSLCSQWPLRSVGHPGCYHSSLRPPTLRLAFWVILSDCGKLVLWRSDSPSFKLEYFPFLFGTVEALAPVCRCFLKELRESMKACFYSYFPQSPTPPHPQIKSRQGEVSSGVHFNPGQ